MKPTSTIHQTAGFPLSRLIELAHQRAKDMAAPVLIETLTQGRYIVNPDGTTELS
jgi:hypothetical protein